jgi:hypothetical protein
MGKCIFFIGEENEKGGFLMNSEMHFLPNVYSQENQVGNPDERIGRIGFGGFGRPGFGFGGFGRPGFGFGGFGGPFLGGLAGGLLAGTLLSPYGYGGYGGYGYGDPYGYGGYGGYGYGDPYGYGGYGY